MSMRRRRFLGGSALRLPLFAQCALCLRRIDGPDLDAAGNAAHRRDLERTALLCSAPLTGNLLWYGRRRNFFLSAHTVIEHTDRNQDADYDEKFHGAFLTLRGQTDACHSASPTH